MKTGFRAGLLALALSGSALGQSPFHEEPSGPRALPGDRLPPFAMLTDTGDLPLDLPPLPPDAHHPEPFGPPESTVPAPGLAEALRAAQAAVDACGQIGFRVGVTVVDSAGEARAMLTADGSDGSHVFVAQRKALVAVAFDRPSSEVSAMLHDPTVDRSRVTLAMFVEGGAVPIRREGRVIGAIGVSGAAGFPIGQRDETCARAGLAAL